MGPSSSPLPKKAQPPIFVPCLLWRNGWIDQGTTWYGDRLGLGPDHIVLDGDPAPPPKKGHSPPHFSAYVYLFIVAKRLDGSRHATWYEGRPRPGNIVLHGDTAVPKGAQSPNFRPMSIVAKRSPISATAERLFLLPSHCNNMHIVTVRVLVTRVAVFIVYSRTSSAVQRIIIRGH